MIVIPDVIGRVIESMRDKGNYTGVTQNGDIYTIAAENSLVSGEWVIINNDEYEAHNVTSSSFDIKSYILIPTIGSYQSLEPYYMFGHPIEIATRLLMKDKDMVYKYQKYPLIALRLPIKEAIDDDYGTDVNLNIAILEHTDRNYKAVDRYDNVIVPVLMPLYLLFIEKLKESSEVMTNGIPEHSKTDRLFYGVDTLGGNEKYIFNDPLDGIEIEDLNLKIIDNCKY